MAQADGPMDRGCGTGTYRACRRATALAAVCTQSHLQKACEERDLDSPKTALRRKNLVTEGDNSNASE